jgi:GntR family transcriptional regulator of arabinose operon
MSVDEEAPLYRRIKRELRAAIARDEYRPDVPFITQRELCERYGVSTTTAVRALNELVMEGVLVRHRGRGTFVAENIDSRPERPGSRDRTVACIIHGLEGPHNSAVVSGVESACGELDFRMFLHDSAGNPAREERALRQAIEAGVAGVVLYPVQGQPHPDLFGELRRRRIPVVLVDRYRPDLALDAVLPDNFGVGYELTNRLIERGHEPIATLWSETECSSVRDRLAGHNRSLQEHGIRLRPELTVLRPYWTQAEGTRPTMLRGLLELDEPPTILLCANGFVLAAAAADLLDLGVGIPDRMELAGMDSAGPFDLLPLTTVAAVLPSREMGERAMRLLADNIDSPYQDPQHVVLPISIRTKETAPGFLQAVSTADPN